MLHNEFEQYETQRNNKKWLNELLKDDEGNTLW